MDEVLSYPSMVKKGGLGLELGSRSTGDLSPHPTRRREVRLNPIP